MISLRRLLPFMLVISPDVTNYFKVILSRHPNFYLAWKPKHTFVRVVKDNFILYPVCRINLQIVLSWVYYTVCYLQCMKWSISYWYILTCRSEDFEVQRNIISVLFPRPCLAFIIHPTVNVFWSYAAYDYYNSCSVHN